MIIFTTENESNNIMVHTKVQDAEAVPNAERFRNEARLAKLAIDRPAARLVEIFSCLPGVSPVKKFTDRKTAVSRIWKAIQALTPAPAQHAPPAAPKKAKTCNETKPKDGARQPREFSEKAIGLDMLKRADGATLSEIMAATQWQAHSVRGFISMLTGTHGYTVTSTGAGLFRRSVRNVS